MRLEEFAFTELLAFSPVPLANGTEVADDARVYFSNGIAGRALSDLPANVAMFGANRKGRSQSEIRERKLLATLIIRSHAIAESSIRSPKKRGAITFAYKGRSTGFQFILPAAPSRVNKPLA